MIGEGKFQTQLTASADLLEELSLLEERTLAPNKRLGAADFKGLSYRQAYEKCLTAPGRGFYVDSTSRPRLRPAVTAGPTLLTLRFHELVELIQEGTFW
jgi:hypothetical protein